MLKSPFKFLESYTKDDREIFFGRDKEIEEVYSRVFESKILLVYGTSGTGKSSLINCGLANKFNDSDWLPVNIRRGNDINRSLLESMSRIAITKSPFEKAGTDIKYRYDLRNLIRSLYLDHFKPVFLIFDQFEEIFIFGDKNEREQLVNNIKSVIDSEEHCHFIFSIREEYLAGITEFEKQIPVFLSNRIRIEKMTRYNAIQTIEGPCSINSIEVEPGFSEALLDKLNPDNPEVELTWLQVFLDKVQRMASKGEKDGMRFSKDIIERIGDVKDLLGNFLEEQISQLNDPDTGMVILKSFVSAKGTKHQRTEDEIIDYCRTFGKDIGIDEVKPFIQKFISLRLLREKDEDGRYELRHDSLASKIFEKITLVEKEILEIKNFIENAYSNFERRGLLLTAEDLKYIALYEDKLFMNEKIEKFISQSKRELHKARRRRQNILISAAAVIFVVLTFFTIWAQHERSNAVKQQNVAELQKDAALKAKSEADTAKQQALVSKKAAEDNERVAIEARNQSEIAKREALASRTTALQEKNRAEQLSVIANEQAKNAESEKKIAEEQKSLAQAAEQKANRLSMLATAQNMALKSLNLGKNPELTGLVAAQAYLFNKRYGGLPDDPVIYEALYNAWKIADSSRHQVFSGSLNEIRAIADNGKSLLTADYDGIVSEWNDSGLVKVIPVSIPVPTDFITISPSGNYLVAGYDNSDLVITRLNESGGNSFMLLKGHSGPVRTAAFSYDESYLLSGGLDSLVILWKTEGDHFMEVRSLHAAGPLKSVIFCGPDYFAALQENGELLFSDLNKFYFSQTFGPDEKAVSIAWNSKIRNLFVGYSSGVLKRAVFKDDHLSFDEKFRVIQLSAGIDHIAFNSDGELFATSGWDKTIRLFRYHQYFDLSDPVGGSVQLRGITSRSRFLMFDKSDKLISSMADKTIRIWETSSAKLYSEIHRLVQRNMDETEWKDNVGANLQYEKTWQDF